MVERCPRDKVSKTQRHKVGGRSWLCRVVVVGESRQRGEGTWVKRSRALCRLAYMPVGGSLVILMASSSRPWGMMWLSGLGAGSALMNTR